MNQLKLILASLCISLVTHAQVPFKWAVESSSAARTQFSCYRGETILLQPVITSYGSTVSNYTATVYWQTNGMDTAWWTTNALVFCPAMDVGASSYTLFVKADTTNGTSYRANAVIRMLNAPGATPNALPHPVQTVDFSAVSFTNAPWLLISDLVGPVNRIGAVEARSNYWNTAYGWGSHAAAGYFPKSGGELNENATITLRDLYLYTTYGHDGVILSSPPFGIATTLNYPTDIAGTFTFATREWSASQIIAATGGLVRASITNGLVSASITNGLASVGFVIGATNGLASSDFVDTAKELHTDSYTNIIWRSVYSNGWTWLIAYTNTPSN